MTSFLAEALPPECMAGTFVSNGWIALVITILGLLFALYALAKGLQWLGEQTMAKRSNTTPPDRHSAKSTLLILWILLPPSWMYCEHIFLYRAFGKPDCFDAFAHAQWIVATGWLATLAVLVFIYFGREISGKD
ncbi:hypothetical protein [Terriglobus albidus]|uniref:hypothetical protein n=1 Tax=Terriglobus albidus TaxID=1592106 RepID=UPI0021DF6229|nr:hypothetical protein [Terriglobus albidus]